MAPPSVVPAITPDGPRPLLAPSAKHAVVLGQAIDVTAATDAGSATPFHVSPSSVDRSTTPPWPPATQSVAAHAIATSVRVSSGTTTGAHCAPASMVRSSIGEGSKPFAVVVQPTATQPVAEKHATSPR